MKLKRRSLGFIVMMLCLSMGSFGLMGCDKLKKMMASKPKEVKGPKTVIIITKPSRLIRIVAGHMGFIRKTLKKVPGVTQVSVHWDKKQIVVGHGADADTDTFLTALRDKGYGVKLKDE